MKSKGRRLCEGVREGFFPCRWIERLLQTADRKTPFELPIKAEKIAPKSEWLARAEQFPRPSQNLRLASAYGAVGDFDKAFFLAEKACAEENLGLPCPCVDARYDSLRSDPRFQALVKRLNRG